MGNTHERRNKENYDPDVVVSTSSPVLFHATHSISLQLSLTRRLVKRFAGCKGICFTNRPIEIGERIYVRIVESSNSWKGALRFGYTCEDPSYINAADLPKFAYPDLTCEQGYWAKTVPASALRQGNILFFYIAEDGSVVYGVNDEEKGPLFAGVRTDILLWALMDVYGNTTAIELVDVFQQSSTSLNSGSSNSSFEQQPATIPKSLRICAESRAASMPPQRTTKRRNASPPASTTIPPPDSSPPLPRNSHSHGRSSLKTSMRRLPEPNSNDASPSLPQSSDDSLTLVTAGRSSERRIVEAIQFMPFHQTIGRNITLSADRGIATRKIGEYCNGYVFTSRPLLPGERVHFSVMVINKDFVGGLAFGVTACNPATLKLSELIDDSDLLLDRPEYWVVRKDVYTNPVVGDELCFHLTEKGEIRYSRNKHHNGTLMHVDSSLPLWAFVDVYGNTQQIQFLGVSKRTKSRHTDRQQSCPAGHVGQLQSVLQTIDLGSPTLTTTSQSIQSGNSAFHSVSSPAPTTASRFRPHEHALADFNPLAPTATASQSHRSAASTVADMTTMSRSNHANNSDPSIRVARSQSNQVNSSEPSASSMTARSNFTADSLPIGCEPVVSHVRTNQELVLTSNSDASIRSPIPPPIPARSGHRTTTTSVVATTASLTSLPTSAPITSNNSAPDLRPSSPSEFSRRHVTKGKRITIDPLSLNVESSGGESASGTSLAPSTAATVMDLKGHAFLGGSVQTTKTITSNSPVVVADRRHSSVTSNSTDPDFSALPSGATHHRKPHGGRGNNHHDDRRTSKHAPVYAQTTLRSAERYAQQSNRSSRFGTTFEDNLSSLPPPLIPVPLPATSTAGTSISSPAVVAHGNQAVANAAMLRNEIIAVAPTNTNSSSNVSQNTTVSSSRQLVDSPEDGGRFSPDYLDASEPSQAAMLTSSGLTTPSSPGYSSSECAICLERPADTALYTCGHMCMCYPCAQVIMTSRNPLCPICRIQIRDVIKIFRS